MNEYDPFDEKKLEDSAPEDEAARWEPEAGRQAFGPAAEIAGFDAGFNASNSAGADAHVGPSSEPAGTDAQPDADSTEQDRPVYQEQPAYQNYYYASDPRYTARPAQGYSAYGQTRTEPTQSAHTVYAQTKTEKRRSGFWKKAVALALVCCLLGGAAGFGGALLANRVSPKSAAPAQSGSSVQVAAPRESTELNVVTVDSGKLMNAAQVYEANVNSTVGITTEITTTNWWGYQSTAAAAGSGFILTEDGYILTNQHVIDKANTITVAMYDGTKYPATLIGYDASNDIAVLKIDAKGLSPVTLGDSDALKVGDEVVAIGNPLGELTFSLTKGNVSALDRAVTLSSSVTMKLIQTDAAINSGNSGGALFNMYGEVVGITNAKYSSSGYSGEASIDNIGFAIPINSVREIVSSIIEKGYISTPYIGVTVGNVSEESQSYGMPQGAAIRSVEENGPAAQGGLQANDIVTAVNGETIESSDDLKKIVAAAEPGDKLELTVYRRGETVTLTVTVGEKTQSALPAQQNEQQSQSGQNGQGQSGQDGQSQNGQEDQNSQEDQSGQNGADPWGGSNPFDWFFGGNGSSDGSQDGGSQGGSSDPWGGFPFGWGFGG